MSNIALGVIPSQVNPDLQEERDRASFNVSELTNIIDGGVGKTNQRKRLEKLIFNDPDFQNFEDVRAFGSNSEFYGAAVLKSTKLFKLKNEHNLTDEEMEMTLRLAGEGQALGLQHGMFIPGLERMATEEQKAKWLTLAKQYKILGAYAQTEMGHGTYLRGLETTATYDTQTQEFVLDTPTISSIKFWPGSLGKSTNHAIVLATLIIKGKKYGMHPFMVQIRSMKDHTTMPGVKVGDIGARMGRLTSDNGYLMLDKIRIPRENMLMKNAEVSADGTFTAKAPDQANYATMVMVRVNLCKVSCLHMSKGATIGIRYSSVRRQSKLDPKEREPKILEYQTQQYKVFPGLALAYAILFSSRSLTLRYSEAHREIQGGNLQKLPELHCESSGMKAFCTDNMLRELEIIRQSCGGHGYLNASGIAMLVTTSAPLVTVEGESTILYLQVARYLLKRYALASSGQLLDGCTSYLSMNNSAYKCPLMSEVDCRNLSALCDIYRYRAYRTVAATSNLVQRDVMNGMPQHFAFNKNLVNLVRAAKAHCYYSVVKEFTEAVQKLKASPQIIKVLGTLCCFFAIHGIAEESGEFLETRAINLEQLKWIKRLQVTLLGEIRPDAVALVDAFDHHDAVLSSAIGSYDGNAYERLFKSTEIDPMNEQEVNPDLQEERDRASFNVTDLTNIIDGGVEKTNQRKRLEKLIFNDPDFKIFEDVRAFGTNSEFYSAAVLRSTKLFKLRNKHNLTDEEMDTILRLAGDGHALSVHHRMFIPALERMATEEQKAKWLTLAKQYKILGAYAQTEMGHGTYLRGLETTATYDTLAQEFVLDTPAISSIKFWPGSLAKSANYAIVLAILIIKGKKHGMHPFLVQIRSLTDHTQMPGVKVGEIGARMGRLTSDNGYLMLNKIRIPRENMLMKNAEHYKFPFLSSNIPSSPAYGVFISQLIRYARASTKYTDFVLRARRLSDKLLNQGYACDRLTSSLRKFYGRYGELVIHFDVPLSRMMGDILS
ncbi:hypothetical protein FSP39_020203 [Pinctada imbricata]|uniref:Acyl-coenzyme A oxidase n=1 Tax=Pinctada imbricata TaxID=66713 RepID=A0AA88YP36_PINIB|nr:hypothetical protein FSP39_020203 [Pinctada imbricata]